ncbi:unnamed protein product [Toxocara canis]|uniref:Pept_C1 domain-containing protein n=1 Tax=Toxocara canis TaxID=6265 RepID=A0A183U968_TOXCA|nr:unnamed protein product [Toxocara canis]
MPVYKIAGEIYVNVSALYENEQQRPSFANYYHYEADEATVLRWGTERGKNITGQEHCKHVIASHPS